MKKTMIIVAIAATMFSSCKKDEGCDAGTGGNVTVVAFPQHHGKDARPYSAWVKFNTQDAPGITAADYDLIELADTTENHIELENLKCGNYYVYMTGYDTAATITVVGGIPFTIEEGSAGEIDLIVPVTED